MSKKADPKKTPWRNGFWFAEKMPSFIFVIDGDKSEGKNFVGLDFPDIQGSFSSTMKFGDFGPAKKEVAEAAGQDNYNVETTIAANIKMYGVVNETGTEITSWGFSNSLEVMRWLTEKEIERLKENRDDFDAPRCPQITPKPEKQGKIFWLSGPPGAGKSTTCQLLARKNGYVYYEADATMSLTNPFIDIYVDNPTMAMFSSKALKGVPREVAETCLALGKEMESMFEGDVFDFDEKMQPLLKIMCGEVAKQKKRLGGDFAVAHAVVSRKSRDLCREYLGPDNVTFVVMNLTKSCQEKRVKERHGDSAGGEFGASLAKMFDLYEPAGEDEEGAFNVAVTEDMSRDDVLKRVLETIAKI